MRERRGFIWRGVLLVDAIIVARGKVSGGAGLGPGRGFLMWMLLGAMTLGRQLSSFIRVAEQQG